MRSSTTRERRSPLGLLAVLALTVATTVGLQGPAAALTESVSDVEALQDAIDDITVSTVELGDDIDEDFEVVTVPDGRAFVLDLNGNALNLRQLVLRTNADVEITDGSGSDDGSLTVSAGSQSAGIQTTGATLTISGGQITASGGAYGSGIGGSGTSGSDNGEDGGTVVISGGVVTASGGSRGTGIGGGGSDDGTAGAGGTITISGGVVTASGGSRGTGIGGGGTGLGGTGGASGNITIAGGVVTVDAGAEGTALGAGRGGDNDTITIEDGAEVYADSGSFGSAIGGGPGTDFGTVEIDGAFSFERMLRIPAGGVLEVGPNGVISGGGSITGDGSVDNSGAIQNEDVLVDVTGHNYLVTFVDQRVDPADEVDVTVYAATFDAGARSFPDDTITWNTESLGGGDDLTTTSDLDAMTDAEGELTVYAVAAPAFGDADLPVARFDEAFHHDLEVTGSPIPTVTLIGGELPEGITLSSDGVLSGIPEEIGTFEVDLVASNDVDPDAEVTLTMEVVPGSFEPGTPVISGDPELGETLSVDTGSWSPTPDGFSYQWLRDGDPIDGATGDTYQVVAGDQGADLSVEVTATREDYEPTTVESEAVFVPAVEEDPDPVDEPEVVDEPEEVDEDEELPATGLDASGLTALALVLLLLGAALVRVRAGRTRRPAFLAAETGVRLPPLGG